MSFDAPEFLDFGSDKPDTVCGPFGPDEEDVNEYFLS